MTMFCGTWHVSIPVVVVTLLATDKLAKHLKGCLDSTGARNRGTAGLTNEPYNRLPPDILGTAFGLSICGAPQHVDMRMVDK